MKDLVPVKKVKLTLFHAAYNLHSCFSAGSISVTNFISRLQDLNFLYASLFPDCTRKTNHLLTSYTRNYKKIFTYIANDLQYDTKNCLYHIRIDFPALKKYCEKKVS